MNDNINLDPSQLYFIPLGGSEQFGVNFNLYAFNGKMLAIDCGIGFADHRFPGVDILLPDITYAVENKKDIVALIVTHAHEDHVGAVSYLWPSLRCPIYCTPFTAAVLRRKMNENPECRDAEITVIDTGSDIDLKPFKLHFVHVAHSIPDTCAVVIETKAGTVVHSGDWNLDPRPVLSEQTDEQGFRKFGDKGVLAYIGDSTNADHAGRAGSESDVATGLTALFGEQKGRIAITIFASNIGRIHSIAKAAAANDRQVVIVGRSLHTMTGAARDCGYLKDIPPFVHEDDMSYIPHEKTVIILTGSQGEARAALAKVARGENKAIKLGRGDAVIFSSRAIPGNETEINAVKNNLVAGGATVITPRDTPHCIHVSGHPYQGELADMYQWVRPKLVVPVHGERSQLEAQAHFARSCQIDNVIVPNNGSVVRLGPDTPAIIDHVHVGLLAVEPNRVISADHQAIAERRKLQFSGTVHVTVVLDDRGDLVTEPRISTCGLIDPEYEEEAQMEGDLADEVEDILADMSRGDRKDDHAVHEELRIGIRRHVNLVLGMKPVTTVHVVRV